MPFAILALIDIALTVALMRSVTAAPAAPAGRKARAGQRPRER